MRFPGRIRRDGRFWLVEVPALDAVTQGRTKREAFEMAEDLIETMTGARGFRATVYSTGGETFEIGANHLGIFLGLLLRRQRERQGLTLAEAAEKLGQRSKNAYARYEQGRTMPTVEKLERVTRQLIEYEEKAREVLLRDARLQIEDKIYRALGALRYCRSIGSQETLNLCSAVRFGVALGLAGLPPLQVLNEMLVFSQPAHLQRMLGRELGSSDRNVARADYVRGKLGSP